MDNTKAYFLMRHDLKMSSAKLAVQVGHGTDMIWQFCNEQDLNNWVSNERRKIVLKIDDETQLNNMKKTLEKDEIDYREIWDNGLTEFNGKTLTGIVVLPVDLTVVKEINGLKVTSSKLKRIRLWRD